MGNETNLNFYNFYLADDEGNNLCDTPVLQIDNLELKDSSFNEEISIPLDNTFTLSFEDLVESPLYLQSEHSIEKNKTYKMVVMETYYYNDGIIHDDIFNQNLKLTYVNWLNFLKQRAFNKFRISSYDVIPVKRAKSKRLQKKYNKLYGIKIRFSFDAEIEDATYDEHNQLYTLKCKVLKGATNEH